RPMALDPQYCSWPPACTAGDLLISTPWGESPSTSDSRQNTLRRSPQALTRDPSGDTLLALRVATPGCKGGTNARTTADVIPPVPQLLLGLSGGVCRGRSGAVDRYPHSFRTALVRRPGGGHRVRGAAVHPRRTAGTGRLAGGYSRASPVGRLW